MLVLSSNLEPGQLVDEAFLRRLHFKIAVPDPTEPQFRDIWRSACRAANILYHDEAIDLCPGAVVSPRRSTEAVSRRAPARHPQARRACRSIPWPGRRNSIATSSTPPALRTS
jgi:hypothetical protein